MGWGDFMDGWTDGTIVHVDVWMCGCTLCVYVCMYDGVNDRYPSSMLVVCLG